jgi:hypothetical protein
VCELLLPVLVPLVVVPSPALTPVPESLAPDSVSVPTVLLLFIFVLSVVPVSFPPSAQLNTAKDIAAKNNARFIIRI